MYDKYFFSDGERKIFSLDFTNNEGPQSPKQTQYDRDHDNTIEAIQHKKHKIFAQ